ncbi:MAG: TRAP transporter small permease [Clostridiales Family XIII bacterium]|jgi:TRAP-type C4-dicarboxylate transport system permease small subunit|nr:TRAP transporter small permease [Clostridiales Family XIII bacterium]
MEKNNLFSQGAGKAADGIYRFVVPISKYLSVVGVGATLFVMTMMVVDVISRKAFRHPIIGAYELEEFGMVLMIVLAFAYLQVFKGHIGVELLVERFPKRARAILEVFANLVCLLFWGAIAYEAFFQAIDQKAKGITTANLLIPLWPFIVILGIGCTCFAIMLAADVLRSIQMATAPKKYLDAVLPDVGTFSAEDYVAGI